VPSKNGKIRVGIIRCDTHGFWYAPFFQAPDPKLYRKNHRGCHYYFYRPGNPKRLRLGTVPGMVITRVYDDDRSLAEGLSESYRGVPKVCDYPDQVSDDVDLVLVANCNGEAEDHLELAAPGLEKGVPHFIDKPFAYTLEDGRKMIELAKKHKTALMCSSLLRRSPFFENFKIQMRNVAPVGSVIIPCGGPSLAGVYHGLSLIQCLMGEGCDSAESMGPTLFDVLRLHYVRGSHSATATLFNARGSVPDSKSYAHDYHHCAYGASAYGAGGAVHGPRVDDFTFLHGGIRIVRLAKTLAETKEPPIPYETILEVTEMVEAARLAHNKGKRVPLKELR